MIFSASIMETSRTRAEESDQSTSLITHSLERLYFYCFQNAAVQYQLYSHTH